ncbi:hypothetical protein QR680_016290 [Steinernema hermaphroditum]|uniref:Uncharacterized protein n=1 Tax=Steinernema hermaphroditum TaxID=289476 RepID=A0AA39HBU2_9BILA|nr:hypothetical protein QR680_016290 [Steinernema hermaphroditum]
MELLVFHPEKWNLLYNCSLLNDSQWEAERNPFESLGALYASLGGFFIVMYMICLKVMWKQRKNSCFKIMIQIGIMDVVNLSLNAVLTGYFTFTGAVYCSAPLTNYVCGALVLGFWCNCCASSVLLALNRLLELWSPGRMERLFRGHRTFLWITLPYMYGFYFTWFTPAPSYSSKGFAWFFDPYVGISSIDIDRTPYMNTSHAFHNVATPVVIAGLYAFILVTLWYKTRDNNTQIINKIQKRLILQSCTICSFNFAACSLYIYIQYQTEPPSAWLVILTQILWICCNCGAVVIYIIMNESIRQGVCEMILPVCLRKLVYKKNISITSVVPMIPRERT